MSSTTPTRNAVIELKDERRAMHEGYVFLDEKCLLLAGEILRQLAQYSRQRQAFLALHDAADSALQAAVARHGLQGLQVYPALDLHDASVQRQVRPLMGVALQSARWEPRAGPAATAVNESPEAQACREAFAAMVAAAVPMAAVSGNLQRLSMEYRRAVRRARALQDVMLPDLDRSLYDIESRLEELEQEDATNMRQGLRPA